MSTKPLTGSLLGEHLLQVEPPLQPFVTEGWRRRPHLYTGRALSAESLATEQRERSGRLALRGQLVAPGVVAGLEVHLKFEKPDEPEQPLIPCFQISPGMGLTRTGEDVLIPRTLLVRVDQVPAFWAEDVPESSGFDLGVLAYANASTTHVGLRAAVLVLVPVVSKRDAPPDDLNPAEFDPELRSLADHRLVDGCVPVLFAWPCKWPMPEPEQELQWRNRLAWTVFECERLRAHGACAPWEKLGVPIALIGFDPPGHVGSPARPLFVDRAAVVRAGGAPRSRTPLLEKRGTPLLWQSRIQQFSEHLATFSPLELTNGTALKSFAFLPPVGTLPKHALNPLQWTPGFFPGPFVLDAAPVPLEQLDAVAFASASLAPLDTQKEERVRVLVPVPEAHFDPRLLYRESVDSSFDKAITDALEGLGKWLKRREDLRAKANVLLKALDGQNSYQYPAYPGSDPDKVDGEQMSDEDPIPPEGSYETEGQTVPLLDRTLWLYGAWSEQASLGWDTYRVSTAASPDQTQFGILTRKYWSYGTSELVLRRYSKATGKFANPEPISYPSSQVDFSLIWLGQEPVIVILAWDIFKQADTHVSFMYRKDAQSAWQRTPAAKLAFSYRQLKHFSAVAWGPRQIDVFVAGNNMIQKVTWIGNEPTPSVTIQTLSISTVRDVTKLVALSPSNGRIELLYLGRVSSSTSETWLHHLSAQHVNDSPTLTPAVGSTFQVLETKNLTGKHLSACISDTTTGRIDVLVMGDNEAQTSAGRQIQHGKFEANTWSITQEKVSQTSGEAIVAVSKGDKQVHAFWWSSPSKYTGTEPLLMYRRFDGSRWQPSEVVSRQWLVSKVTYGNYFIVDQPFAVLLDGTNPLDVFLASNSGLQHVKKFADSTKETLRTKGLRGLIKSVSSLYQEVVNFIDQGTTRLAQELQHVRQLMLTSSTEASRLAVSATLGSTLVDSPLVARTTLDSYLTQFHPRSNLALIRLSDAMEALEQATTIRRDLIAGLVQLVRRTVKEKEFGLDVTGLLVTGISKINFNKYPRMVRLLPGWRWWPGSRYTDTKVVDRENIRVSDLVYSQSSLTDLLRRLDEEPENIRRALTSSRLRWTEFDYFSTSVRHMEDMLTLLRAVRRRIEQRMSSVNNYKATLGQIERVWSELDTRLKAVDSEVAEGRQDVTVARALRDEEEVRVNTINQRRQQVYDQHVPFLVFQRPRERELTREAPSRLLDTGIVEDILPEVLASTAAAPPELLAYLELVRDSPLKWFAISAQLLRGLDRIELIHRTFVRAQVRAVQRLPIPLPIVSGRATTSLALGLSRLLSAREDLIARQRSTFVYYQPPVVETRTWLELQQTARAQLSLGDIMDTAHGRSDVSRNAATELEHISRVATGLYQRFGEVLPVIRLEWAEQMSQYDIPVNLRDLSRLPLWEKIEVTDRREMQMLVDWLFQRVVPTESEAVALINDLVRVCLLLASHAPVNELLSGHVTKPTVAKVGGTIELAVDPARVRIGMQVVIRSGDHTVQAVVEDLASNVVRARVLSASSETVHLQEKASARFADPARGASALMPLMGYNW
ncbi:hypothetical protein JRI60_28320 [Archangium violaceum]|uniref:hypothetical protein n=1 Tax=Archangium violaceum TaxID=83451 RepID=UPI00194FB934|nr:hypothetical protein [Archangium violaceum]QRN93110.1 hypothetical protein JRI60_28320 [Archangium violaceum]